MTSPWHRRGPRRGGFFLVIVLIVIVVATMACYSFTELMIAYDDSAYLSADLVQARVNVESASESIKLILSQPRTVRSDQGGVSNNPNLFQAITVSLGSDGQTPSNFSVIATALDEQGRYGGIRFGLQDESARLNLNTLIVLEENGAAISTAIAAMNTDDSAASITSDNVAVSLLMGLPNMTQDVAEAILDWMDDDDEPREMGAEAETYTTLPTPYQPSNGPLHSVEELLLVRGVTPTLLFGADANRNGVLDADEQQRSGVSIDTPGALGWAAYLTVRGAEANVRDDGQDRINVNGDDLELLYDQLSEALGNEDYASYIIAYRIAGTPPAATDPNAVNAALGINGSGSSTAGQNSGDAGNSDRQAVAWTASALEAFDMSAGAGVELSQVLDLIGSEVTYNDTTYRSPFGEDPISMALYMPILMDVLTTQDTFVMPGRINLNECAAELLYGIPLLAPETVDAILQARAQTSDDPNRRFETWPMVEGLITLDQMKLLLPLLTGGGDVFRAQIIGYYESTGTFHRAEIVFDATTPNPKIVSIRDLSHLGRGFDLSTLGLRSLGLGG